MSLQVCCSSPVDETRPVAVATNQSLLPKQGLCGRSQIQTRIIGGSQVRHGEFPWITALGYSGKLEFLTLLTSMNYSANVSKNLA